MRYTILLLCLLTQLQAQTDTSFIFDYPLVAVEGGCFMMGCDPERDGECEEDEILHQVCLSDFMIGKYEVTQAQWEAIMGENPSAFQDPACPDCPVEKVSWEDIEIFLKKLKEKTGLNYRLPTEAEWEYAARGGNKSQHYKYAGTTNDLDSVAWYRDISGSKTHPVGQKAPNELGIYDMSGNVFEWCADAYTSYAASPQQNPTQPGLAGAFRCLRGGSWDYDGNYCRAANRIFNNPDYRYSSGSGLRLVLLP
jgi:sulfatase modifying factor 1